MRRAVNSNGQQVGLYWSEKALVDPFGNYISYQYSIADATEHYLTSISYGGNINTGGIPYTKVQLGYVENRRPRSGYVVGNIYHQTHLLSTLTITIDGQLQSRYLLSYNNDAVAQTPNQLTQIKQCVDANNSNCSSPITFTWTTADIGRNYPLYASYLQPTTYPTSGASTAKLFDMSGNGKANEIYVRNGAWHVYDPSDNSDHSITTIGAKQSAYALPINYNGDGQGDLLVANDQNSNWHVLTMLPSSSTHSSCEPDGHGGKLCSDVTWHSATTVVDTGIKATGLKGKTIIADVDGDGLEDIITIDSTGIHWHKNNQGSFATKQTLLTFENSGPFAFSTVLTQTRFNSNNSSSVDINGDGKTDLVVKLKITKGSCIVNGRQVPVSSQHECANDVLGKWTELTTDNWHVFVSTGHSYVEWTTFRYGNDVDVMRGGDFNGDGLTDIAYISRNQWYVTLANGHGFEPTMATGVSADHEEYLRASYIVDLDGDGQADILAPTSSSEYRIYLTRRQANTLTWQAHSTLPLHYDDTIQFADTLGMGHFNIYAYHDSKWSYLNYALPMYDNTVRTITDGYGVDTDISYKRLTSDGVYTSQTSDAADDPGNFSFVSPILVTRRVTTETGNGTHQAVSYQYGGMVINRQGRGFLGFELLRTIDEQTGIQTDTLYNQSFPLTGTPRATLQSYQGQTLNHSLSDYEVFHPGVSDAVYQVNQTQAIDDTRQLGVDGTTIYPLAHVVTTMEYDDWGNALSVVVNTYDLNSSTLVSSTTTTSDYDGAGGGAAKGRLSRSVVTKERFGQLLPVSSIQRTSSFTYDANTGVLQSETLAPDETSYRKTTTYQYDNYGNTLSTAVTGAVNTNQQQTRTTRQTYDSRGRYLASSSNVLGETTTYSYNGVAPGTVTGPITRIATTDANGLTSSTAYDAWGRTVSETDPIGLTTHYSYVLCGSCSDFSGAYAYTQVVTPGAPQKISYVDKYGRDIGSRVQGFASGTWIATHQSYDAKGRVKRQYQAALTSDGISPYYTELDYDIYDRVLKTTQHTQTQDIVSEHWYQGLIEVAVDAKDRQVTQYQSADGELIKIEDQAYNTLDYVYDPYGNLLSVWLDNGTLVRTQSHYDTYGRKTQTTDLDKGTVNYRYNAFGELLEQTNAAGQHTTFSYDLAGRSISRTENEQRTCWVYGTAANHNAGRLLSERIQPTTTACSSNSGQRQRKDITYDSYGRVTQHSTSIGNAVYAIGYSYDNQGRQSTITYPGSTLTVLSRYNSNGYLYQRENAQSGALYQRINTMDAQGHATDISYGNGTQELKQYADDTGALNQLLVSGGATTLQDISYQYDPLDLNITSRTMQLKTADVAFTESYAYDQGNPGGDYDRLYQRNIIVSSGSVILPQSFKTTQNIDYDRYGNIRSKSTRGHYQYSSDNPYQLIDICATEQCTSTPETVPATPSCPSGYTLSSDKQQCTRQTSQAAQSTTEYECKIGSYNASSGLCRQRTFIRSKTKPTGANISCSIGEPDGGGYKLWSCIRTSNPTSTTTLTCPQGWNLSGDQCVRVERRTPQLFLPERIRIKRHQLCWYKCGGIIGIRLLHLRCQGQHDQRRHPQSDLYLV